MFVLRTGQRESRNIIPTNGNSDKVVLIGAIIRKFQGRFCYSGTGRRQWVFFLYRNIWVQYCLDKILYFKLINLLSDFNPTLNFEINS